MLTAAVLLCADPLASEPDGGLASTLEQHLEDRSFEVVAASPVPAGARPGSHYGWRTSTRTGRRTFHAGVDFLVDRGTPAYAVREGVVELVTRNTRRSRYAGYGNAVVVRHPGAERWSFYAHLDSVDVEEGQRVAPGERLGTVGNTTNGRFPYMVPHLHFEVRRARRDGSSPFPGRYRRHNLDPEQWLASLGVDFDADGARRMEIGAANDCEEIEPGPLLVMRARDDEDRADVLAVGPRPPGAALLF
ncbi:MAG TPA: M23 family metallopeptidase [Sandaracinaceae bacterium LLY-WYZ-13_1]|nr:M23 family metallopeptidase [Sandaracinaceae bacterium LLY-WYZ-13_1]